MDYGAEVDFMVSNLRSSNPQDRYYALQGLSETPLGAEELRTSIQELLNDDTPVVTALPFQFGEVRWMAAYALAAEYRAAGITQSVRVDGVVEPITQQRLVEIAQSVSLRLRGGVEGLLAMFAVLRDRGLLPTITVSLEP